MQWLFGGCSDSSSVPHGIALLLEVLEEAGMLAVGHPAVVLMCSILLEQLFAVFSGQLHP